MEETRITKKRRLSAKFLSINSVEVKLENGQGDLIVVQLDFNFTTGNVEVAEKESSEVESTPDTIVEEDTGDDTPVKSEEVENND